MDEFDTLNTAAGLAAASSEAAIASAVRKILGDAFVLYGCSVMPTEAAPGKTRLVVAAPDHNHARRFEECYRAEYPRPYGVAFSSRREGEDDTVVFEVERWTIIRD